MYFPEQIKRQIFKDINANVEECCLFLGDHDRSSTDGNEQRIRVKRTINHPNYNDRTINNDIALLELERPATFNRRVKPVCLPQPNQAPAPGTTCYITG